MGIFISGRVAITATGVTDEKDIEKDERGRVTTDVIYIRPKMDYGTRSRVAGAAAKYIEKTEQASGNRRARRAARKRKSQQDVELDVGAYQIALLVQNVLGWDGPLFQGVACVPANVEKLDPDHPLVQEVLKEISERNTQASAPDDDDASDDTEDDDPNVLTLTASAASETS